MPPCHDGYLFAAFPVNCRRLAGLAASWMFFSLHRYVPLHRMTPSSYCRAVRRAASCKSRRHQIRLRACHENPFSSHDGQRYG